MKNIDRIRLDTAGRHLTPVQRRALALLEYAYVPPQPWTCRDCGAGFDHWEFHICDDCECILHAERDPAEPHLPTRLDLEPVPYCPRHGDGMILADVRPDVRAEYYAATLEAAIEQAFQS